MTLLRKRNGRQVCISADFRKIRKMWSPNFDLPNFINNTLLLLWMYMSLKSKLFQKSDGPFYDMATRIVSAWHWQVTIIVQWGGGDASLF